MKSCAFWWESRGLLHVCAERAGHDVHRCSDEDCDETVPVDVRGGRVVRAPGRERKAVENG